MPKMKHKSKEACVENLQRFFAQTSSDVVTADEIYKAWGRDISQKETNKAWLSTLLIHLKYHDLVKPVYAMENSRRVLNGVKLTQEGKRALGRDEYASNGTAYYGEPSQSRNELDLMKLVAEYRKNHPEYEVIFNVKLKD